MTDLRTAAQQALEALNVYASKAEHRRTHADDCAAEEAITALRAALAEQPVRFEEYCLWARNGNEPCPHVQKAEPVQEPVAVSERERWAFLLRAAGRVLQAFDDGYLQPDLETLHGSIAVDALRESWAAFAPVRIQGPNCMAAPPQRKENT